MLAAVEEIGGDALTRSLLDAPLWSPALLARSQSSSSQVSVRQVSARLSEMDAQLAALQSIADHMDQEFANTRLVITDSLALLFLRVTDFIRLDLSLFCLSVSSPPIFFSPSYASKIYFSASLVVVRVPLCTNHITWRKSCCSKYCYAEINDITRLFTYLDVLAS